MRDFQVLTSVSEMNLVKQKSTFEHMQNPPIKIILRMRKVYSWPFLSIHTFCKNQGQWMPWLQCVDAQADLGLRCPHSSQAVFARPDDFKLNHKERKKKLIKNLICCCLYHKFFISVWRKRHKARAGHATCTPIFVPGCISFRFDTPGNQLVVSPEVTAISHGIY